MKFSNSGIKWGYIFLTILVISFIPFPTELIPEMKLQIVDVKNQPLPNVNTEQNWKNYTFFGVEGAEERCSDAGGTVVYPRRVLWASAFSRIAFPVLAQLGTIIHGSTGTDSYVRVFDRNYISDFQYWREEELFYSYKRHALPTIAVAKAEYVENAKSCQNQ
jgi:hypothetical protein